MNNPDLQKWLLAPDGIATRLRTLRGATTGKAFAEAAGMRATKLSKLELAQQEPTADDIRAIVAAAGQPSTVADELVAKLAKMPQVRTTARISRFGPVAAQQRLNRVLRSSDRVRLFEATYLPRPMQTLEYAKTVLTAATRARGLSGQVEAAAETLVMSSRFLHEPNRKFEILLVEPVLRWPVLPSKAMRDQLEQVLQLSKLPTVDLRVLPLDEPTVALPAYGFGIVDGAGYFDTLEGAYELTEERLAGHDRWMASLWKASVDGFAATDLIKAAFGRLGL